MVKDDLHKQRPSRDRNFSNQVNTKLRAFQDPDGPLLAPSIRRARSGHSGLRASGKTTAEVDEARLFRRQYVVENSRPNGLCLTGPLNNQFTAEVPVHLLTDHGA